MIEHPLEIYRNTFLWNNIITLLRISFVCSYLSIAAEEHSAFSNFRLSTFHPWPSMPPIARCNLTKVSAAWRNLRTGLCFQPRQNQIWSQTWLSSIGFCTKDGFCYNEPSKATHVSVFIFLCFRKHHTTPVRWREIKVCATFLSKSHSLNEADTKESLGKRTKSGPNTGNNWSIIIFHPESSKQNNDQWPDLGNVCNGLSLLLLLLNLGGRHHFGDQDNWGVISVFKAVQNVQAGSPITRVIVVSLLTCTRS